MFYGLEQKVLENAKRKIDYQNTIEDCKTIKLVIQKKYNEAFIVAAATLLITKI